VGAPRDGVQNLFYTGEKTNIPQQVLWATIQSHDVMTRYKKAQFKDDPSISAEYIKFLATNSGTDSLTARLLVVEEATKESSKQLKSAVTGSSTAASKADDAKKLIVELTGRVRKLETTHK
jgi:hypothetical protein